MSGQGTTVDEARERVSYVSSPPTPLLERLQASCQWCDQPRCSSRGAARSMFGDEGHQGNRGSHERAWRSPTLVWLGFKRAVVASKRAHAYLGIGALFRWERGRQCLFTCVSSDPVCVVRDLGSVLRPSEHRRFTARVRRWHQQLAYRGSDLDEIGLHRTWVMMGWMDEQGETTWRWHLVQGRPRASIASPVPWRREGRYFSDHTVHDLFSRLATCVTPAAGGWGVGAGHLEASTWTSISSVEIPGYLRQKVLDESKAPMPVGFRVRGCMHLSVWEYIQRPPWSTSSQPEPPVRRCPSCELQIHQSMEVDQT